MSDSTGRSSSCSARQASAAAATAPAVASSATSHQVSAPPAPAAASCPRSGSAARGAACTQLQVQRREALGSGGAGEGLGHQLHRHVRRGDLGSGRRRRAALEGVERAAQAAIDAQRLDRLVAGEGLEARGDTGAVAGTYRAGDGLGGVRGDAPGAGGELRPDALTGRLCGERAERLRVLVLAVGEDGG